MEQDDAALPKLTLTVPNDEGVNKSDSKHTPDNKEILLPMPSSKSKLKDLKKGRSNSLYTKKPESTLANTVKSSEGSPRIRNKKDMSEQQQQRRHRRRRLAQGMKPCPQEILDETSWKSRIADYFVIISPEINDNERHHSTILPGITSTVMVPVITDRVPHENYKDTVLPGDLGMFCFPNGIISVLATERPPSTFHYFNLTDENGTRLYVACLRAFKKNDLQIASEEKMRDYIPVALCIVSHHPFISLFKAYLCKISEIMASPSKFSCPPEAYISTILFDVPMPTPGSTEIVCSIDESHDVTVSIPSKMHFPIVDVYLFI